MVNIEKARQLRRDGKTFKQIATEVECTEGYIRTLLSGMPKGVKEIDYDIRVALKRISEELAQIAGRL